MYTCLHPAQHLTCSGDHQQYPTSCIHDTPIYRITTLKWFIQNFAFLQTIRLKAIFHSSGQSYDKLIKTGRDDDSTSPYPYVATDLEVIPNFLQQGSKVTMHHKGALHKCYTHFFPELGSQFAVRINSQPQKFEFTVPLQDFKKIGQHYLAKIWSSLDIPPLALIWSYLQHQKITHNLIMFCLINSSNLAHPFL